ncbi:hypothetical protein [Mycobacterium persicum]|uniref:hypothetical protein n=1 Tax=Mycobacterium persicum TaxID=1487726 RepID=UPI001594C715|nr:hypothetical protein [Mycobacterium persicum]
MIVELKIYKPCLRVSVWQLVYFVCLAHLTVWRKDVRALHRLEGLDPAQQIYEVLLFYPAETPGAAEIHVIETDSERSVTASRSELARARDVLWNSRRLFVGLRDSPLLPRHAG